MSATHDARVVSIESGIIVRDAAAMVEFCQTVLGFAVTETVDVPGIGQIIRLRRDEAHVKLFVSEAAVDPPKVLDAGTWQSPGGWRYVTLCLDSARAVDAVARRVVDHGGRVFSGPYEYRPGSYVVVISDVEENVWEVISRAEPIP